MSETPPQRRNEPDLVDAFSGARRRSIPLPTPRVDDKPRATAIARITPAPSRAAITGGAEDFTKRMKEVRGAVSGTYTASDPPEKRAPAPTLGEDDMPDPLAHPAPAGRSTGPNRDERARAEEETRMYTRLVTELAKHPIPGPLMFFMSFYESHESFNDMFDGCALEEKLLLLRLLFSWLQKFPGNIAFIDGAKGRSFGWQLPNHTLTRAELPDLLNTKMVALEALGQGFRYIHIIDIIQGMDV